MTVEQDDIGNLKYFENLYEVDTIELVTASMGGVLRVLLEELIISRKRQ